jgi:hypothetical protein
MGASAGQRRTPDMVCTLLQAVDLACVTPRPSNHPYNKVEPCLKPYNKLCEPPGHAVAIPNVCLDYPGLPSSAAATYKIN